MKTVAKEASHEAIHDREPAAQGWAERGDGLPGHLVGRLVNSGGQQFVATRSVEKIAGPGQRPQARETRDAKQGGGWICDLFFHLILAHLALLLRTGPPTIRILILILSRLRRDQEWPNFPDQFSSINFPIGDI